MVGGRTPGNDDGENVLTITIARFLSGKRVLLKISPKGVERSAENDESY